MLLGTIISFLLLLSNVLVRAFPSKPPFSSSSSIIKKTIHNQHHDASDTSDNLSAIFSQTDAPFLALITERGSCDSDEALSTQLEILKDAIGTQKIHLVSVRINMESSKDRVLYLIENLLRYVDHCGSKCRVVVSSDWIDAAVEAKAHGVHVKETHRHLIPEIRTKYQQAGLKEPIIGTSTHSIESALDALSADYNPDYFFCGTCYYSESHPEKGLEELEGPELPGQVLNALRSKGMVHSPVLAIGGIDATNCHVPVRHGASGVAAIRGVLQSPNPVQSVEDIITRMTKVFVNEEV